MQIIPVIDLLNGQVVHAKRGERQHYQPIQSLLSASSDVFSVVEGLLKLYPFCSMYIADIDAITNTGNHFELIELLSGLYPQVNWWVDTGINNVNARILYAPQANIRAVFGSENIHSLQDYRAMSYAYASRHVLSLDKLDGLTLGAIELNDSALYWPDDVICMTLNNVGSNAGPDMERLQALQRLNQARKKPANIFAAGGVRGLDDLVQLKKLGIHGALIATALHHKQLLADDIKSLSQ